MNFDFPYKNSPLLDSTIKRILSFDEDSAPLLSFLNAFQEAAGKPQLVSIFPWTREIERQSPEDKLTISDVAAKDNLGRIHQVEIQTANHPCLLQRNVYSWARRYGRQIRSGVSYTELNSVIHILVTTFPVFPQLPELYHLGVMTLKNHPDIIITDHFEFHILELTPHKIDKLSDVGNLLSRWGKFLYFANQKEKSEMIKIAQDNPGLQSALDRYYRYCQDNGLRYMAEMDLSKIADVVTALECSERNNLAKGKAEGSAEKLVTVLRHKFGDVPSSVAVRVFQIQDLVVLDSLFITALDCKTLEEFEDSLP